MAALPNSSAGAQALPEWVGLLKSYVKEHALAASQDFDSDHDVQRRLRQIFEERQKKLKGRDPTFASIPRFYHPQPVPHSLADSVRKIARDRVIEKKELEILNDDEL
jgi:hypothetical protein